jgi:two-component system sensor histidine kinase UhpB
MASSITPARTRGRGLRSPSLLWRVAVANAAVFTLAVSILALSPATVSFPVAPDEAVVLALGTVFVVLANLVALRGAFAPLVRLSTKMARLDPLDPGVRVDEPSRHREIVALTGAFNQMAERLEHERRDSARRALHAEEAERRRIAQDLHDQIGQSLTFLLIQLSRASAPGEGAGDELAAAKETARAILEDTRVISRRLRPEALDDLGLVFALESLAARVREASELDVVTDLDRDLPALPPDAEVALLRVAQEALTNVVRHAGARTVVIALRCAGENVRLEIRDDGRGLTEGAPRGGIRGMRERALSIGASLTVAERASGGTRVTLALEPAAVAA